jgi:hypothetical protein
MSAARQSLSARQCFQYIRVCKLNPNHNIGSHKITLLHHDLIAQGALVSNALSDSMTVVTQKAQPNLHLIRA